MSDISLDNTSQGIGAETAASLTFSHTIGAGSNRLLIVGFCFEDNNQDVGVTSVTYNSAAVTEIDSVWGSEPGPAYGNFSWLGYLLETDLPSAGSYSVIITLDGSPTRSINAGVASYFDVGQSLIDFDSYGVNAVTTIYTTVTAAVDGSLVCGIGGHGYNQDLTGYDSTIILEQIDGSSSTAGLLHKINQSTGDIDIGFSWSSSKYASIVAAVFSPPAEGFNIWVNAGGWKQVSAISVNTSSGWKTGTAQSVNIASGWKSV